MLRTAKAAGYALKRPNLEKIKHEVYFPPHTGRIFALFDWLPFYRDANVT
jgi:hypothetical protein